MAERSESQSEPHEGEQESHDAGQMAEQALGSAQDAVDRLKDDPRAAAGEADRSADAATAGGAGETDAADEQEAAGPNVDLPSFQKVLADVEASGLDLLHDVDLNVKIELGRTHMLVEDVLRLNAGSVVELDKLAGDPVDVYVNDRLVARGEVLVLNDNFCVRISEIVATVEEADHQDERANADEPTGEQPAASDATRSTGG